MLSHERAVKIGRLGGLAYQSNRRTRCIERYHTNPKMCKACNASIPYEKRRNNYCNHSCRARVENRGVVRNKTGYNGTALTSEEERATRVRMRERKYRERRKSDVKIAFGETCKLCGYNDNIVIHRKDGSKHENPFTKHGFELIMKNKDEYDAVCYLCHGHVHWCMKTMGMSWEHIIKRTS